jgi:hypothetical protein
MAQLPTLTALRACEFRDGRKTYRKAESAVFGELPAPAGTEAMEK